MDKQIRALLEELKAELKKVYQDRLKGVYLFGSYARGDEEEESDVDVLVVLDRFDRYGAEIDRTSRLGADLSLKYGVSISKIFMTEGDWLKAETPFLTNVRDEAIPA